MKKKNVLIGQKQGTAKNGITPNSQTVNTSYNGAHTHALLSNNTTRDSNGQWGLGNGARMISGENQNYTGYYWSWDNVNNWVSTADNHAHSLTFTPSITFNDIETRPINYTIKVWKRTA